jgi:hypothetical protein
MNRLRRNGEWSVVLFVVALLAFNPPILSIFSVPDLVFGIPTLYLYIFLAWGGAILLLALNVSGLVEDEEAPPLRIPGPPAETLAGPALSAEDDDVVGDGRAQERGEHRPDRGRG